MTMAAHPKGGENKPRKRAQNGADKPLMLRLQPEHRELVEVQSNSLGISRALFVERCFRIGVEKFRRDGKTVLQLAGD
jgi:hypothetical protein